MLRLYDAKRLYVQDKWETYFSSFPKNIAHILRLNIFKYAVIYQFTN